MLASVEKTRKIKEKTYLASFGPAFVLAVKVVVKVVCGCPGAQDATRLEPRLLFVVSGVVGGPCDGGSGGGGRVLR